MTETEKLLGELVALPSVNPAFLPEGHRDAGEARVAEYLGAAARRAGLDVDFQKVAPGRSNVIARLTPAGRIKQRIVLAPHMDTVAPSSEGQFLPRVTKGRLYGRGACDTKGSIAAMFTALSVLARERRRPTATEVILAGLIDEENAQAGSRAFASIGKPVDLAIVGEPTRLRIITAHKGSVWLSIETRGKAAHGSCPELGKNAVHEMSRVVDWLETDYARQLRRRRHPLLGCGTISVGSIRGGTQPNIVPARCVASADRRTLPGESEKSVRDELRGLLRRRGLIASIEGQKSHFCLPMETDPNLPVVKSLLKVARQSKPCGVNYFCDASVLAQAGIPSVVFGPGDIAQAHTADEWVELKSVDRAAAMLLKFFRALP
ncbi:MAG TPA: M20/M25/M40 family metallo-hydrolase [Candidatus Baltobacteraceae bacterium]|nr:M20/M25/M40 family metallo-hydrolase [Candidatus Baltobacteraceae bacterium]